jgi:hypothetical protein
LDNRPPRSQGATALFQVFCKKPLAWDRGDARLIARSLMAVAANLPAFLVGSMALLACSMGGDNAAKSIFLVISFLDTCTINLFDI